MMDDDDGNEASDHLHKTENLRETSLLNDLLLKGDKVK